MERAFVLMLLVASIWGRPEEYPPPEVHAVLQPLHDICTQKLGVTDDEIENYEFSYKSKKMMCYMKCLMVESKWGREDETIDYDYIRANCHPKVKKYILASLEQCRNLTGEGECERFHNFFYCMKTADPVHYFLP